MAILLLIELFKGTLLLSWGASWDLIELLAGRLHIELINFDRGVNFDNIALTSLS